MLFGSTIEDTRVFFYEAWVKFNQKKPLSPLEQQIARVIADHPEYQPLFNHTHRSVLENFSFETVENPFLHMGLHLTLRDQIKLNRPLGITKIYQQLLKRHSDQHETEHVLMQHLADCLWMAQKNQTEPNEQHYLKQCGALLQ